MTEEFHHGYEVGDRIIIPETIVDGDYTFQEGLTGTIVLFDTGSEPNVGVEFDEHIRHGCDLDGAISSDRGIWMYYREIAPCPTNLNIDMNIGDLI